MTSQEPGLLPLQAYAAYDRSKTPRAHKRKDATAISEHRALAIAEALGPTKRERIKSKAREAAARVMAEWDGRLR